MLPGRRPPRCYGNTIVLMYWMNYAMLTIGPHWPFSLCLLISIIFVSSFIMLFIYLTLLIAFYIGLGVICLQVVWFGLVVIWGPGHHSFAITEEHLEIINQDISKWCRKWKIVKTENVEHWMDWNTCIIGYDHHWAWTSKWVGKWNLIFFYAFTLTTALLFVYLFLAVILIMLLIQNNNI